MTTEQQFILAGFGLLGLLLLAGIAALLTTAMAARLISLIEALGGLVTTLTQHSQTTTEELRQWQKTNGAPVTDINGSPDGGNPTKK